MLSMSFIATPAIGTGGTTPGPRMDLLIKAYTDPTVEFLGLQGGDIDLMDWPLDQSQLDAILPPGPSIPDIAVFGFAETGMFLADINKFCDASNAPFHGDTLQFANATGVYCGLDSTGQPLPLFDFPRLMRTTLLDNVTPLNTWTSSVDFRKALAHLRLNVIDSIVTGVTQAKRLDNQVPANVAGGASDLTDNTQNFNQYNGGRLAAHNILEAIGLSCPGWNAATLTCPAPRTDTTTGSPIVPLRFFFRSDDPRRTLAAQTLGTEWEAVGVDVDLIPVTSAAARVPVFRNSAMNMYTGGWIFVIDPDYVHDLYSYAGTFPVGTTSLNYGLNGDQTYFDISAKAKFGAVDPAVNAACPRDDGNAAGVICGFKQTLARHAARVVTLPFYGNTAVVGARRPYWEPGSVPNQQAPVALRGLVNANSIGPGNSFWSILNAYRTDLPTSPYGGTFRWGFKSPMVDPNPITSEWLWDALFLSATYDSGLVRDPYDLLTFRNWIYSPATLNAGTWSGSLVQADYSAVAAGFNKYGDTDGDGIMDSVETYPLYKDVTNPGVVSNGDKRMDASGGITTADCDGILPDDPDCGRILRPRTDALFPGGGSKVSFVIQTGIDLGGGLGNAIRFHPHPALTLPGPDNVLGTGDDVAVAAQPNGKVLDGLDVEASIEYVRDHVGFGFSAVADVIDVKVCGTASSACLSAGADGILYTADDVVAPLGDARRVEVYSQLTSWLARNFIGGLTIVPSDIWSINGTPGSPADDPIPNPVQFSARDPNNDGNQADHVLYGTGAWTFAPTFDISTGGTLPRNIKYFTPARTPIDPDVNGVVDITLPGGSKALGVDIVDVQQAGLQFSTAGAYAVRFDTDYDRDNDLDDLLITTVYFQFGNNPSNPTLTNAFRTWPDTGAG